MLIKKILIIFSFFILYNKYVFCLPNDEIDFFNVGQGHAVLINKVGRSPTTGQPYVPLLIDAGATIHPYSPNEKYEWEKQKWTKMKEPSAISHVSERILDFWKYSTGGTLRGGNYSLNIIITHPDEDHKEFIPFILEKLGEKARFLSFSYTPYVLLGGTPLLYPNFLQQYPKLYSSQLEEISFQQNWNPLNTSECITHLFCPKDTEETQKKDASNTWSIITRIQINGISAILTGDADWQVKEDMLTWLGEYKVQLLSDILLAPHHGARNTYHSEWDTIVNPRAIVIGSAPAGGLLKKPKGGYRHPRGETILEFLTLHQGRSRIWEQRVMPHAIQYHCNEQTHQQIQDHFRLQRNRLFDQVPNSAVEKQTQQPHWQLTWIDLPIYTLWTTGTLFFKEEVKIPQFIEAPHGILNYIAVPQPEYLFSPLLRSKLTPLTQEEKTLCIRNSMLIKTKHEEVEERNHIFENIILKETLLTESPEDRSLFLEKMNEILNKEGRRWLISSQGEFFQWLREAIVGRNKRVNGDKDRVHSAIAFLFRESGFFTEDWGLNLDLFSPQLESKVRILKAFLSSNDRIERLKDYIEAYGNAAQCGSSNSDIEVLCPSGFPEWLQLAKLGSFFRNEVINPTGESLSIMDIEDIVPLRLEGRNFKEIAQHIINIEGENSFFGWFQGLIRHNTENVDFQTTREELHNRLENYFPNNIDEFLI